MSSSQQPAQDLILEVERDLAGADVDLEFQDFSTTAGNGNSGGAAAAASAAPPPPPPPTAGMDPVADAASRKPIWTVDYYKQYFNVDTADVTRRMMVSVLPREKLLDVMSGHPDLYGPFWITTTVVFLVFVTNSIAKSIDAYLNGTAFEYDFTKLTGAATALYLFISIVPLAMWGLAKYMSFPVKLIDMLALYGYGLTIWVPLTLLTLVPSSFIHWIAGIVGIVISVAFMVRNSNALFSSPDAPTGSGGKTQQLLLLSALIQVGVGCMFMFWLFAVGTTLPKPTTTTSATTTTASPSATVAATIAATVNSWNTSATSPAVPNATLSV